MLRSDEKSRGCGGRAGANEPRDVANDPPSSSARAAAAAARERGLRGSNGTSQVSGAGPLFKYYSVTIVAILHLSYDTLLLLPFQGHHVFLSPSCKSPKPDDYDKHPALPASQP
jgi:hypothetical protein